MHYFQRTARRQEPHEHSAHIGTLCRVRKDPRRVAHALVQTVVPLDHPDALERELQRRINHEVHQFIALYDYTVRLRVVFRLEHIQPEITTEGVAKQFLDDYLIDEPTSDWM